MQPEVSHDPVIKTWNTFDGRYEWWKHTATAALTAVAFFVWQHFTGSPAVSADEVREILKAESQYAYDREGILGRLDDQNAQLKSLQSSLQQTREQLAGVQSTLDSLVRSIRGGRP